MAAYNLRFRVPASGTFAVMTRLRTFFLTSSVAAAGTLVLAAGASAASTTTLKVKVTGLKGGSVLAVNSSGTAVRSKIKSGTTSLRVPRSKVSGTSLHLADAAGRYRGPVVLTSKGSKAWLTLGKGARKSSVSLGTARARSGYAALSRKASTRLLLTSAYAKASRGVPVGAGRLGLQKAAGSARAAQGSSETIPGGTDPDRDGLPSNIDVDDNGNGILDNQDASQTPTSDGIFASMNLRPSNSGVNVNATGVTDAQIDANLTSDFGFSITFYLSRPPSDGEVTGAWVDCGALPYCNYQTGTALIGGLSESRSDLPRGTPWRNYKPDPLAPGNGLEELARDNFRSWAMGLIPKATSAQLSPGDIYNVNLNLAAERIDINTIALPSYPVTVPAVKTVTTGGTSTELTYGDSNAPGTNDGSAIPLSSSGDLSMVYWRPQRRGVPGAGEQPFMDMGRLHYTITVGGLRVPDGGSGGLRDVQAQREFSCDASGNALFPETAPPGTFFGPADPAEDSAPNAASTRTYSTNLRTCIEQALPTAFPSLGSIPAGAVVNASFTASGEERRGGADRATLSIAFRL